MLTRKAARISSAKDLPGKTVATVKGSTYADVLKDLGIAGPPASGSVGRARPEASGGDLSPLATV